MGWKMLAMAAFAVAAVGVGAGAGAGNQAAPQQAQMPAMQDPEECTKLVGIDAQMDCLARAIRGIQDMSANVEPIEELPPDEPRIVGDPSSGACYLKGKAQPVWPNGQPMGGTVSIDECVANHGAVVADFVEWCQAGMQIAKQSGPNNLVMRYMKECPAKPKSMCSLEPLAREGADPDDPASYTARIDFHYYAASDSQADAFGCTNKRFF